MKKSEEVAGERAEEAERMDVGPEHAEYLREGMRQKGEANANVGLVLLVCLAAYVVWLLLGGSI